MGYKFALIGLGEIAKHYSSLLNLNNIHLISIVDKEPSPIAEKYFQKIRRYFDYRKLYSQDIDFVLVATTAENHYTIIKDLLVHKISVVSEKPLAGSHNEILELYKLAKKNNVNLIPIYHWQYTDESLWLKENTNHFGKIKNIKVVIHDNYASANGVNIVKDRIGMMGTTLDELPNALSIINEVIPLTDIHKCKILHQRTISDKNCGYNIFSNFNFMYESTNIDITIEWRKNLNDKSFLIEFFNNDILEIFHSEKKIYLNGELKFSWENSDSLEMQYYRLFKEFDIKKHNKELTKFLFEFIEKSKNIKSP